MFDDSNIEVSYRSNASPRSSTPSTNSWNKIYVRDKSITFNIYTKNICILCIYIKWK